jgi:hypothetical protein
MMLNGAATLAVPDRVPLPVFCTVKERSSKEPTATDPYACEVGVTDIAGTEQLVGAVAVTVLELSVPPLLRCART